MENQLQGKWRFYKSRLMDVIIAGTEDLLWLQHMFTKGNEIINIDK